MEDYVFILDYMQQSSSSGFSKREPLIYAVGVDEFKLFELVPKSGVQVDIGVKTYIGKEASKREVVDHVKRRIKFDELTNNAQTELPYALQAIVLENQDKYIRFYNEAESISLRRHLLEELPGFGKKSMELIVDKRQEQKFKDFEDITARTGIKTPEKFIAKRIEQEITESNLPRYLFVSR